MEAQGYNVSYATSEDLDQNPNLLRNHKMFLSNFHDEYYSKAMRDNLTAARDQGTNLAFFTSNNIYWQTRYESSASGVADRVLVCYKDATTDPMATSSTPWLTTVLWRDSPVNQPENALLGVMFQDAMGYGDNAPWVVQNSSNWVYAGTGLNDGDQIPLMVGYEFDRVWNNGLTPANLVTLSDSPVGTVHGIAYNSVQHASIYTAPSGAIVFNASINYWAYFLNGNWIWPLDTRVQRMTTNILNRMIGTTVTPTSTNTPGGSTFTPTAANTNTPTMTLTSGPSTPTSTLTNTATPALTSGAFYRAINLGGNALVIDGNNWEADTAPNFATTGTAADSATWQALNPSTDANRTAMIQTFRFGWNPTLT